LVGVKAYGIKGIPGTLGNTENIDIHMLTANDIMVDTNDTKDAPGLPPDSISWSPDANSGDISKNPTMLLFPCLCEKNIWLKMASTFGPSPSSRICRVCLYGGRVVCYLLSAHG
jgi:hypothetical protein